MPYPAISDHGVIGDMRTAALVARNGTIDFLCAPEFDSPTVFARLLDTERGGSFTVATVGLTGERVEQRYLRDTNVLVTRFSGVEGEVELVDFMPVRKRQRGSAVVRLVRAARGSPRVVLRCVPRFDYAEVTHRVKLMESGLTACFEVNGRPRAWLTAEVPLVMDGGDVTGALTLERGQSVAFVLELDDGTGSVMPERVDARRLLRQTVVWWRRWITRCRYRGEWKQAVRRSALVLKLLQSQRTGAIVAAPTFGLPEQIGGTRNWDFRYAWVRDASYTVYALARTGLNDEARGFTSWIVRRFEDAPSPGALQSLYGIDGRRTITESTLDHLAGYRDSRPVRVGNAAYDQLQLDVYGELMDALYISDRSGVPTSGAVWQHAVALTSWVCANWRRADQGIWEVRTGPQEFLFSRVMCWVAVDRALRIARRRRFAAPHDEWRAVRAAIHDDVHAHFWNEHIGAFVGTRESTSVDAACLVMPLVEFIDARDPRWLSTLRVVEKRLVREWLVRRYDMEGMDTDASHLTAPSFTLLSFWYIECLARGGFVDEARAGMRRVLAFANHLGLFAENLGRDGEQLGNFPQGLVHSALIGAALALFSEER